MTNGVTSFSIDLERPSGIYYSGEVVRGSVRLITSKEIKTRGARIRFQGNGYVHWHTGSGKNRHSYQGFKIFEQHRYTMFGNFYNTTILDSAGENATFGAASGDGIMYIPCNMNENLKLIVRVMDYDFGKKDDLLGELVLDVNELTTSGGTTSYPLRRHGKTEKGEVSLSAKIIPVDALFPASIPRHAPSTNYNAICQLRAHQATGLRKADWFGKNDVYVQAYRGPLDLNLSKKLPEPDISTILPAGLLEFPFAFQVRPDAPGSCEMFVGDQAYIRYSLYANIDIAWWKDPSVKRVITVLPSRPLASPVLLRAVEYKFPQPVSLNPCCCLPCFSVGSMDFEAKLMRQAFAPGEMLEYSLRINNTTDSTLSLRVELVCTIILQSTGMDPSIAYHTHTHGIFSDSIEPQHLYESSSASGTSRLAVPIVFPSFNGASGLLSNGSINREPLTFAYSVVFSVFPPGTCASNSSISFPV